MKLKALTSWTSHAFNEDVKAGERFETNATRARDLIASGRAEEIKAAKKSSKKPKADS